MKVEIKMTGDLYREVMRDFSRPHNFVAERVGFVFGRLGTGNDQDVLILLNRYHSIPDDQYIDNPSVGACIGSEAITWAMQAIYHGRQAREGIFHIHRHEHSGETGMSVVDRREIPKMIPGFRSVGSEAAHGLIILSHDHGSGWVWMPGASKAVQANSICVIGHPIGIFEWVRKQ